MPTLGSRARKKAAKQRVRAVEGGRFSAGSTVVDQLQLEVKSLRDQVDAGLQLHATELAAVSSQARELAATAAATAAANSITLMMLQSELASARLAADAKARLGGKTRQRYTRKVTASLASTRKYNTILATDLETVLTNTFGGDCLEGITSCSGQDNIQTASKRVTAMFREFFMRNDALLEDILSNFRVREKVEQEAVAFIQALWDRVALDIALHVDVPDISYQKLINLVSNVWDTAECTFEPLKLPYGTKMAKLCSQKKLGKLKKKLMESLGLQVGSAGVVIYVCCAAMQ
jgi:hypothetical protein